MGTYTVDEIYALMKKLRKEGHGAEPVVCRLVDGIPPETYEKEFEIVMMRVNYSFDVTGAQAADVQLRITEGDVVVKL